MFAFPRFVTGTRIRGSDFLSHFRRSSNYAYRRPAYRSQLIFCKSPVSSIQPLRPQDTYGELILSWVRTISTTHALHAPAPDQEVLVVDGMTSKKLGVMKFMDAEALAGETEMLLHLVGRGKVPVYKMMSAHALKELQKSQERQEQEAKKKLVEKAREKRKQDGELAKITKELKMTAHAGAHDVETKLNQAKRFLAKGLRVKFVVTFRRRQARDKQQQAELMQSLLEGVAQHGQQLGDIEQQGMYVICVVAPRPQQHPSDDNDTA
eukprot:m.112061 g.112061  ORF g.112061 m.112061 type:complete len:265 (+) comp17028_c0_seq1:245-1039(+)